MSAHKLLVVIGATGNQGSSVIRSMLADSSTKANWKIRAVTRNLSSEKAKALTAIGVECVTADMASKESLVTAFAGADAVFAVTNYWEALDMQLEIEQGKNVADAARQQGVKHLVWSSLLDVNKLSGGKYADVYHFDSKAQVEEYIKSIGQPATFFLAGFYMSNITDMMSKSEDDIYSFAWPVPDDTPFPLIDIEEDTGKFVKAIITQPEETLGKRVYGANEYMTPRQMIEVFDRVRPDAKMRLRYDHLSSEAFYNIYRKKGMKPYVALELLQTYEFIPEFGYYGKDSLDWSINLLTEKLTTFEEFVMRHPAFKGI